MVTLHSVLPGENYLTMAENFFDKIEKRYLIKNIYHSYSKDISFLEDYAFLIQALLDLADTTMNPKYRILAKKYCSEVIEKFYDKKMKIFQKNEIEKNDIFFNPIDISDNTIPNGNAVMLINFSRLGFISEAKELSNSLNGYLNIYKGFMTSSLKAIDIFNDVNSGKKCNSEGCTI